MSDNLSFYNGLVQLEFDEDKHAYYLLKDDGSREKQDGVTQTCGILDKSMFLIPWALKLMEQKLLRNVPHATDRVDISWDEFVALVHAAKKRHQDIFEESRNIGLLAHKWIEDSIRWAIAYTGGVVEKMNELAPVDERAVNCGMAAFKWMQAHNVRWLKTERRIYSKKYHYAGTMDGLAKIDSCVDPHCCAIMYFDELALVDWKSSNALRTEYLYQTAAYEQAEEEEFGEDIKARWILRLGKDDGEFEHWYATDFEKDFQAFLLCLKLRRAHRDAERRIAENRKRRKHGKERD